MGLIMNIMRKIIYSFVFIAAIVGCKDNKPAVNENIQNLSTETAENQEIEIPDTTIEPEILEKALLHEILEHNGLGNLQLGSTLKVLTNTALQAGDSLVKENQETTNAKNIVYHYKKDSLNLIDFHITNNRVKQIEILENSAVPPGMLAPGSKLGDIYNINDKVKPYGNEEDSQARVVLNNVTYILDARHPIEEPLDLYLSTPIVKIRFTR